MTGGAHGHPPLWLAVVPLVALAIVVVAGHRMGSSGMMIRLLVPGLAGAGLWPIAVTLAWTAFTSLPDRPRRGPEFAGTAIVYSLASWTVMLAAIGGLVLAIEIGRIVALAFR